MRMLVTIAVNLYTVRVLWRVLGVDNYGIYNIVGGIVMMFAFLNNAMVASSQRFISFGLGKGDMKALQKTFSLSVVVHALLAAAVFILAETAGIWFLNAKLNIPPGRVTAANWVFQCTVFSFLLNVISVPYNACIVAHEHMKVYGTLGILDILLKLVIVWIVAIIPFDRLIVYAILVLAVSATMRIIYGIYCRRHFQECKYVRTSDRGLMKDMFSFAGWSFLGNMGFSVRDQGMNIILNMFFNVAVNAAKGIANNVGAVINGFASNFTMAVNPQITKRYASGAVDSMMSLMFNGCKYSLLLMSVVVIPLVMAADTILKLWLVDVAPYTAGFLKLVLIMSLVDCVVSPIVTAIQATGKIKKFQIVISIIMILNLPLAWMMLKFDLNPYMVMYVAIITSIVGLGARLILLHQQIVFSYWEFFKKVYLRTIPCILFSAVIVWELNNVFSHSLLGLIGYALVSVLIICIVFMLIALDKKERMLVVNAIKNKFKR